MLDIQVNSDGGLTVIHLVGDFSGQGVTDAAEALSRATSGPGAKLVIDLAKTKVIDSSGLGAMMETATRLRLRGGNLVLVAPNAFVGGVLRVTRLDQWFDVCGSIDEARRVLSD